MTTTRHAAYTQAAGSIVVDLSTGLNSLANNTDSATFDIDNTSNRDLVFDFELLLGTQTARTGTPYVALYMTTALDGTNYGTASITTAKWICDFPLEASTAAQRLTRWGLELPPGLLRGFIRNVSSQAFNASGNTLRHRSRSYETV